jgi:hypothetical protein
LAPRVKLVGFMILLALIFLWAHASGARLGPVTTSHYVYGRSSGPATGEPGMGGMNMGGSP